ncbi:OmpA family protein [Vibrio agarivorans]|uniref:OmpA family protein n=1 Tax=Vibrio agarivorans TaxID=153622 RepID=UPI0025B3A24C|nr:OmpA family protein [Vibrio agarivorans]MDN3662735.1 OmpA family protein [Vibrio agarivorans]
MKKLAVAISAAVVLSAQPAFADFYIGAKAGKSWLDDACISGGECDDEANHFGGFVGYDFLDYLALELGYDDLGKHTTTPAGLNDDRVSAWTLAPKFTYHINDLWGIYAKVGGAYVDYGDEDDWSYLGAAGVELTPHPKIGVRLEYQTLTDINNKIVRAEGNSATLGVLYRFGASEPAVVAPPPEPEQLPEPEPEVQTMKHQTAKMGEETFALNSAELTEAAQSDLDKLAAFLNKYPQSNVELVGHTDSSGSDEYNQQLSEKRANAVADALVERGISEDRITARGVGESELEYDESTPEGRKKNRFVEIIVPEFEYQVEE